MRLRPHKLTHPPTHNKQAARQNQAALKTILNYKACKEHPTMHYFGNPRYIQSMTAYNILTEYFLKFQYKIALWECSRHALLFERSSVMSRCRSLAHIPLSVFLYFSSNDNLISNVQIVWDCLAEWCFLQQKTGY